MPGVSRASVVILPHSPSRKRISKLVYGPDLDFDLFLYTLQLSVISFSLSLPFFSFFLFFLTFECSPQIIRDVGQMGVC